MVTEKSQRDINIYWAELQKGTIAQLENAAIQSDFAHFTAIIGFAKIAIHSALLLNGMAGIAVMYNLDRLGNSTAIPVLFLCAIGASCATLCAGLSYITQSIYATKESKRRTEHLEYYKQAVIDIYASGETELAASKNETKNFGHALRVSACVAWVFSLACFVSAVYRVYSAYIV